MQVHSNTPFDSSPTGNSGPGLSPLSPVTRRPNLSFKLFKEPREIVSKFIFGSIFFAGAFTLLAQEVSEAIVVGSVFDPSGSAIRGAAVTLILIWRPARRVQVKTDERRRLPDHAVAPRSLARSASPRKDSSDSSKSVDFGHW